MGTKCLWKAIFVFSMGALTGTAVTHRVMTVKYEKLMEERIDSYRNFIMAQAGPGGFIEPDEIPEDLHIVKDVDVELEVTPQEITNYVSAAKKYNPDASKKEVENAQIEWLEDIDMNEFHADYEGYEKITLNYYDDDYALTDEDDNLLQDAEYLIGDALERFDRDERIPVLYVRNHRFQTQYELVRIRGSYQAMVMNDYGVEDDYEDVYEDLTDED